MRFELLGLMKSPRAVLASIGTFIRVNSHMLFQFATRPKPTIALFTNVRCLFHLQVVFASVARQAGGQDVNLIAIWARKVSFV